jgi:hypothetical protein
MSDQYQPLNQGSSSSTDLVTALQGITRQITAGNAALAAVDTAIEAQTTAQVAAFNTQLTALIAAITAAFPPRIFTGSFTLGAAATTVVTDANVLSSSIIVAFPTNAAAGTLMGSAKSLYISAKSAGVSFTVATASAAAAAGTETFSYVIVNP